MKASPGTGVPAKMPRGGKVCNKYVSVFMKMATKPVPRNGVIELELAGVQLRVRGQVDESSLCSVLRALRQTR